MLLTLETTHTPATDLGFLLHKHPDRPQSFELGFGRAHVFYPESTEERCQACLLIQMDPVELVKRMRHGSGAPLRPYVNDRPFVASSFTSVALSRVFSTAMSGRCAMRPELADTELPLVATLSAVPSPSEAMLHQLFEPLGYRVTVEPHRLDDDHPEWRVRTWGVELEGRVRLSALLTHLYVLLPVLDADKHYYIDEAEVEKLLSRGEGWLASHPQREIIALRYLKRRRSLVNEALRRLEVDDEEGDEVEEQRQAEVRPRLDTERLRIVGDTLEELGARSVLDLGCGEGKLLQLMAIKE